MKKLFPLLLILALLLSACGSTAPAQEKDTEPEASASVNTDRDEAPSEKNDADADAGKADADEADADEADADEPAEPAEAEIAVVNEAATDGLSLAEAVCDTLTFSYPDETWLMDTSMEPLTFFCLDTLDSEIGIANINVQVSVPVTGKLNKSDLKSLCSELTAQGMTPEVSELRTLNGTQFIYIESTMEITDSLIDFLIEDGSWTEEYVESLGGREALKAIPPTSQIYYYIPIDGYLVILVGTYYEADSKQAVCDAMTIMAQTGKISG